MNTAQYNVEIAVIGASLGGVLAAWRACEAGRSVVLTSEFDWIGGQLTAQGVPPDEHRLIEHGGASASYLAFRRAVRAHYLSQADFVDNTTMTEGCNPGDGWVSRLCIEPVVALRYLQALLAPHIESGRLQWLQHTTLVAAERHDRKLVSVEVQTQSGEKTQVRAQYFLDGTDTGALIRAAGLEYRIGKESHDEFGERAAPAHADRLDQQPCTVVVALALANTPQRAMVRSASYEAWCQFHVPHYGHRLFSNILPGHTVGQTVALPFFGVGQTLDLWRYRRVISSNNWRIPRDEVSLINWAQNDYALSPLIDGPVAERDVIAAAKDLSASLAYWLQTDAPRDDSGHGYERLRLAGGALGSDGFAQQVYVRESRRIVGLDCLTQMDIVLDGATGGVSEPFHAPNSVGVAWYNMDIHPTCVSGRGVNSMVRPFTLPLGCFVARDCDNLIPACKNISVTHLVNAATRTHPVEWLIGEVAALLADYALQTGRRLAEIHQSTLFVHEFQRVLSGAGIPIRWDTDLINRLQSVAVNSLEV